MSFTSKERVGRRLEAIQRALGRVTGDLGAVALELREGSDGCDVYQHDRAVLLGLAREVDRTAGPPRNEDEARDRAAVERWCQRAEVEPHTIPVIVFMTDGPFAVMLVEVARVNAPGGVG